MTMEDDQTSAKNAHTKIRETYFVHCSSVALARGTVATDSHNQTFLDATPMLLSGCIELYIVQTVWLEGSTKKGGFLGKIKNVGTLVCIMVEHFTVNVIVTKCSLSVSQSVLLDADLRRV